MNFLNGISDILVDLGRLLISPDKGPPIIVLMIFLIISFVRWRKGKSKKPKPEKKEVDKTSIKKTKSKTKRKWKLNFSFLRRKKKSKKKWDLYRFMTRIGIPLIIAIGAWLTYVGIFHLSVTGYVLLAFFSAVATVFATRSTLIRWSIIWGFVGMLLVFLGIFVYSLNLPGDPHPIKVITVTNTNAFQFDAREPRWTAYDFQCSTACFIDLSAFGEIDFDTSDGYPLKGYPPNGPDGVRHHEGNHEKNGIYYLTPSQVKRPWEFIYGFQDKPFACLIGKIGIEGDIFIIGDRCQIPMKPGDILYLGLNYRWRRVGGNNAWRLSWKFAKGYFNLKAKILPTSRSA